VKAEKSTTSIKGFGAKTGRFFESVQVELTANLIIRMDDRLG